MKALTHSRQGGFARLIARAGRGAILFLAVLSFPSTGAFAGELESFLRRLAEDPLQKGPQHVAPVFAWDKAEARRGRARVLIRTAPGAEASSLRAQIEAVAPSLAWEGAAGELCQIVAAWTDLPRVAQIPGVTQVFRSPRPVTCREVRSEGIDTMRVPAFQAAGLRGAGSRIGILDLGFEGYERFLGTELGSDVVVRSFYRSPSGHGDIGGGGIDHGIACAEIVHDIAPEARLYLVNVETLLDLQNAVEWLIDEHVSVISHSVGWYFGGLNGRGPVNDMADKAARNDILWVNAAGNEAERHTWAVARDLDADHLLEFDEAGDETLDFTHLAPSDTLDLVLLWDDWPRARSASLDLEMVDEGGEVIASTADQAAGNPYAIRVLSIGTGDGEPVAARVRAQGNVDGTTFHVFRVGQGVRMEDHPRADRSLLVPADSPSVLATGAVYWRDLTLDSYSSRGTSDPAGPVKPEICAPVAVTTAIYGREGFRGTSAATPHAAGAAGLLVSAGIHGGSVDLQWTREELISLLSRNALPLPDAASPPAWGLVRMPVRFPEAVSRGPALYGNPASGRVRWNPDCGEVEILNVAGRVVARRSTPFWDGLDRESRPAAPGIYFVRSVSSGASARLVWLGR